MKTEHLKIGSVPALLYYDKKAETSGKKGTILFYHGLGVSKEINSKELESFAREGFLGVSIDNVGHGERRFSDFDEIFTSKNDSFLQNFLNAVQATVNEIPSIIDELIKLRLSHFDRIGISGISMGGYITYGSVIIDKRIKVAAPILGNPEWKVPHLASPHNNIEKFYPVALLSQTAGADEHVPPKYARRFHESLEPFYINSKDRLKYVEFPGAHHIMPENDWNILWNNTIDWFNRFLPV